MRKKTREEIISEFTEIHGDTYDYSNTEYTGYNNKVCIGCKIHGPFYQLVGNHLRGDGCPSCSKNKKLTTEDFILKARLVWGYTFDYSDTVYEKNNKKVKIKDWEGNAYYQTPSNHLSGYDCRVNRKETTENLIKTFKKIHGDKYDYSKTVFVNNKTKVCITCPIHGDFYQLPSSHSSGKGCPKCGQENTHKKQRKSLDEFIEISNKKHNNKYDYSLVGYKNVNTDVVIVCPIHGKFNQKPYNHMMGCECPKCSNRVKRNNEEIKEAIKKVHGNTYILDKIDYINNHTKIELICKKHGSFHILPTNVLRGQGCPVCGKNRRKKETKLFEFLRENLRGVKIIQSYRNKNVLGRQEIDIFLPEYKIGIEFQGEQHFKAIDFGGYGVDIANKLLSENKERDKKKLDNCLKENIKLFYFSNLDYDMFLDKKIYHNENELLSDIIKTIENEKQ